MEKEFVPYELAWELKQLGFDEPCLAVFNDSKQFRINLESRNWNDNLVNGDTTSSPTFQQVFRWFREKHNIDAWVQLFVSEKQNGKPFLPDESYAYYIFEDGVYVADGVNFLDYEEAELACLQKLIEIIKTK